MEGEKNGWRSGGLFDKFPFNSHRSVLDSGGGGWVWWWAVAAGPVRSGTWRGGRREHEDNKMAAICRQLHAMGAATALRLMGDAKKRKRAGCVNGSS